MSSGPQKYQRLLDSLKKQSSMAIAFSGGIDSTFLLYAAARALGPSRVTALYARSTLNAASSVSRMRNTFRENFDKELALVEIEVFPLNWQEFIQNSSRRCYFCKNRMYIALKKEMKIRGCVVLADGTNVDDLKTDRPGLLAIKEHQVYTPLVEAGLGKQEIRDLAESQGLSNFDLPSNSCLATRLADGEPVTEAALRLVEMAEDRLEKLGMEGTRVRIRSDRTLLEVQKKDLTHALETSTILEINSVFDSLGLPPVSPVVKGR